MQPPSSPIEVQTQLKILDLYELYLRSALWRAWYGRMALALALIFFFAIWEGSIEFLRPLLEPPLVYVELGVVLYSILVRPYLASRSLIQTSGGSISSYVFSESGIDVRGNHFRGRYDWAAIRRAKQSAHLVFLYVKPNSVFVLPKRCFSNAQQLNDFRVLLTRQIKDRDASSTSGAEK